MSAVPDERPRSDDVPDPVHLTVLEKLGYAAGDTGLNLYWRIFDVFLMIFYTDVFGLSPVAAGTMLMVARLWDGINDPLMGLLADRTQTRWGTFRPYLVWMALPMALTGVLAFTTPDWSHDAKLVYAYVSYIAMMTAYTAIGIPYSSLMGVLTPSSRERTSVSTYRFVGAFIGGMAVMVAVPQLVAAFDDPITGWPYAMMAVGGVAVCLFLVTFVTTRERVRAEARSLSDVGADLSAMLQNRPFWVLGTLTTFLFLSVSMRGATGLYLLNYVIDT
ncbi:MAG: glycoside-pentoside-hexuronide (GPH):cation symporter, partial [Myxococcota bacterium]